MKKKPKSHKRKRKPVVAPILFVSLVLVAYFASLPYTLGQVSTIFPPDAKERLSAITPLAAAAVYLYKQFQT